MKRPHVPLERETRLNLLRVQWQRLPLRIRHRIIGMVRAKLHALQMEWTEEQVRSFDCLTEQESLLQALELAVELMTWTLEE
jgi:hypothetical protein